MKTKIGCVVMAAGSASRFGNNKLLSSLDGVTLAQRAIDAVPLEKLHSAVVVTGYPEIAALAHDRGLGVVLNDRPEDGASRTVRLGVEALEASCDAILFLVSDQPLLTRQTVADLIDFYHQHPGHIVAAAHNGVRGNPCLFPRDYFNALKSLTGDTGGSAVIRRHEENLLLMEVSAPQLEDVDTPEALRRLQNQMEAHRE
ncbi:MAG: nucleotidyltransferase family protein [Oscillospiraceae bacterium]|nr:nucleotidyltransferase family protein [Oscillospiraceae bacterium]